MPSSVRVFTVSKVPPSINSMYRAVAGRSILSREYREWKALAAAELAGQPGFPEGSNFIWRSDILFPCNVSKADIDNVPKAVHDALVRAGKVPDDRYLADSRIRWGKGDQVVIAVQQEELPKWTQIKTLSRSLTKKLAKRLL